MTEPENESKCAVCGRDIFRPWIGGIQEPWKHWVEPVPDGHAATPKPEPFTRNAAAGQYPDTRLKSWTNQTRTEPLDLDRQPEWITLAAVIRAVDGNHDLGAGALAQAILAHPDFASLIAEAREAARLRTLVKTYLDASAEPAYSWVIESQEARAEGRSNREVERMDRIAKARQALRAALVKP